MTLHQAEAFGLIGTAVVLFIWGRFRYDLVALAVLFAGVVLGVVPAKKAFEGFSNEITVIIGAALVVSAAVARSGVVERVMRPILPHLRTTQLQVPVLVVSTTLLSMMTKNVGALAIMMPVALQLSRRTGSPISHLLMPMSFGALLGGTVTLIGTSPNIIVSEVRAETFGRPFQLFDFAPVGLTLAALGAVFLSFAYRLLPTDRKGVGGFEAALDANTYVTEAKVPHAIEPKRRTVAALQKLGEAVRVKAILRRGERRSEPADHEEIRPGDVVLLEGEQKSLDQVVSRGKLELAQSDAPVQTEEPTEEVRSLEAVINAGSILIGRSAKRLDLQQQFGVKLLAVSRADGRVTERLRNLRLQEGDVLVLQAGEKSLPEMLRVLGCLPLAERPLHLGGARGSLIPIAILAVAMGLVAFQVLPVSIAFLGAAIFMVAAGSLPMREAYAALDGHVLILIAALVPVSEAVRASGGTELIASAVTPFLSQVPPIAALALLTVTAMVTAPFLHNVPTVLVLGPIAASLAKHLHLNPDPFLMGVAVGAACDFLTPIGHQCNTLVMGPGGYRFADYPRLGAPLSVMVLVVGTLMIAWWWKLAPG